MASFIRNTLLNPLAAERLLDEVDQGILGHLKAPTIAPVYRATRERPQPYRWFSVGEGYEIEVRRFIYGARDLTRFIPETTLRFRIPLLDQN